MPAHWVCAGRRESAWSDRDGFGSARGADDGFDSARGGRCKLTKDRDKWDADVGLVPRREADVGLGARMSRQKTFAEWIGR